MSKEKGRALFCLDVLIFAQHPDVPNGLDIECCNWMRLEFSCSACRKIASAPVPQATLRTGIGQEVFYS